MSARSRYLKDRPPVSTAVRRFESWLRQRGYESCADMYPASVQSVTLVDEYFDEYPERDAYKEDVEEHAEAIGWVSDYSAEEDEDADDDSW